MTRLSDTRTEEKRATVLEIANMADIMMLLRHKNIDFELCCTNV